MFTATSCSKRLGNTDLKSVADKTPSLYYKSLAWRGLRFLSTRKHSVKISADLKDKTCWQRGPFVSCIGGQRSEGVSCSPTGGLSRQQWRTGDNGGCKLCGSGCVRLSAGLSCGWRDCRTGGTRSRAGGPPHFGNCLLTSGGSGPTGWDFQTGASLLSCWCVCVCVVVDQWG